MVFCPECGSEVEDEAAVCPLCSCPIAKMARQAPQAPVAPPQGEVHKEACSALEHEHGGPEELIEWLKSQG